MKTKVMTMFAAVVMMLAMSTASQAGLMTVDFSSGNGDMTGTGNWAYNGQAWSVNGHTSHAYDYLTSPVLTVAANGNVTGSITHRFSFEVNSDGGQIQYRVNGGTWKTVQGNLITGGATYAEDVYGFYDPAHPTEYAYSGYIETAFNGDSTGYSSPAFVTSTFTLGTGNTPYYTNGTAATFAAGDQIELQFKAAWDPSVVATNPNWQITSMSLDNAAVPEPATMALLGLGGLMIRRRKA